MGTNRSQHVCTQRQGYHRFKVYERSGSCLTIGVHTFCHSFLTSSWSYHITNEGVPQFNSVKAISQDDFLTMGVNKQSQATFYHAQAQLNLEFQYLKLG